MARPSFQTKSQYVEEAIRDAISSGELRPGMWVRSEDWAARLETSFTPVREAMQKLEAEGLLRVYPYRGAQVAGITRAEFEEVYQLRGALEGLAGYRAITAIADAGDASASRLKTLVTTLEGYQQEMDRAIAAGEHVQLRQANKAFHFAIYTSTESPRLVRLIENLWVTFPWGSLSLAPGRPPGALHEHAQILDAVKRLDAEGVRQAVTEHIDRSAKALLAAEAQLGFAVFAED